VSSEQKTVFSFLSLAMYVCSRSFEYDSIIQYLSPAVVLLCIRVSLETNGKQKPRRASRR